jgi:hypothetical protein
MRRVGRKGVWILVLWTLVAGVGTALAIYAGNSMRAPVVHVDQETCDRILPGMTVADVEKIIGGPAGWYDGIRGYNSQDPVHRKGYFPRWVARTGEIVLDLDEDDRITGARFYPISGF